MKSLLVLTASLLLVAVAARAEVIVTRVDTQHVRIETRSASAAELIAALERDLGLTVVGPRDGWAPADAVRVGRLERVLRDMLGHNFILAAGARSPGERVLTLLGPADTPAAAALPSGRRTAASGTAAIRDPTGTVSGAGSAASREPGRLFDETASPDDAEHAASAMRAAVSSLLAGSQENGPVLSPPGASASPAELAAQAEREVTALGRALRSLCFPEPCR